MRMPFSVPVMAGLLIGAVGLQFAMAQKPGSKPARTEKVAQQEEAVEEASPGEAVEGEEAPEEADQEGAVEEGAVAPTKENVGYAIGLSFGKQLKEIENEIDTEAVIQGFTDVMSNAKPKLTPAQLGAVMEAFSAKMQKEAMARAKEAGNKAKSEGEKFLADNKKKEGIKTTKSGLQYKVLKQGKGKTPKATDTVTANYRGTLVDGTVFDESAQPVDFPLNRVIAGWTEVLQLMKEGSKYQVFIPSELGYGADGSPGAIPPHSTLIFDIELISVAPPADAP